jgi:hypothetical protein
MMLAVAFMAVLLAVSPLVPGVKWLEAGDFNSTAEVVYYHTVMFELVMLGLLTVSYVVGLPQSRGQASPCVTLASLAHLINLGEGSDST